MPVTSNTIHHALKRTIDRITDDDKTDSLILTQFTEDRPMDEAYEDDLETGGPGLMSEVTEGDELPIGSIVQGFLTRYVPRKYGMRIIVTEETIEDNKYPETIRAAARLKRAIEKTADIDAALMLQRMFDTNYPGGDGQPLGSASHTLPQGGTFSNIMAVPVSPSRTAVINARTQAMLYPGHDGITEGYDLEKVVFPLNQWGTWEGIIGSGKAPENDSNEINVVNTLMDLKLVPNKYWSNSTTNYAFLTEAKNGMCFRWRRKPKSKTWMTNEQELKQFSLSARWTRGWSDARGILGVNA